MYVFYSNYWASRVRSQNKWYEQHHCLWISQIWAMVWDGKWYQLETWPMRGALNSLVCKRIIWLEQQSQSYMHNFWFVPTLHQLVGIKEGYKKNFCRILSRTAFSHALSVGMLQHWALMISKSIARAFQHLIWDSTHPTPVLWNPIWHLVVILDWRGLGKMLK